jgi:hypothetical protein
MKADGKLNIGWPETSDDVGSRRHFQEDWLPRLADLQGPRLSHEGCPAQRKTRFSRSPTLGQAHQQAALWPQHEVCGPSS